MTYWQFPRGEWVAPPQHDPESADGNYNMLGNLPSPADLSLLAGTIRLSASTGTPHSYTIYKNHGNRCEPVSDK